MDKCPKGATTGRDTIVLQARTYGLALSGAGEDAAVTGDLDLAGLVTIRGAGTAKTIVDGNDVDRIFHVLATGNVTISALTVEDGYVTVDALAGGGGILNAGALSLAGVVLRNNEAHGQDQFLGNGGGLFNDSSAAAYLTRARVTSNSTTWAGGGIYSRGTISLERSTVSGNTSNYGGAGLLLTGGQAGVRKSSIAGNHAGTVAGDGGGINNSTLLTIAQSTISGNTSRDGDGLYSYGATVTLVDATLSGNGTTDSGGKGGGIYNAGPGATVNLGNVTLSENSAAGTNTGGNLWNESTAIAKNSLLVDAGAGSDCAGAGTFTNNGNNLDSDASCSFATMGNAALGPLQNNGGPTLTHALGSASDAIDAGAGCESADQRGVPRPTACDIGAYELVKCLGAVVNRVGTEGPDHMIGTAANEVFLTLSRNDFVNPGGGADRVCVGGGDDTVVIRGGGRDRADGGSGTRDRVRRDSLDVVRGFELFF